MEKGKVEGDQQKALSQEPRWASKTGGQSSNAEESCPSWFVHATLLNKMNNTESDCKD